MTPALNWKEIQALCELFSPEVEGLFVDRIVIPERPRYSAGYVKGEWAMRLTGRHSEGILLLSIRPRHVYIALRKNKGPKAAAKATHSPFDLAVSKHLKGSKLVRLEAVPRERTAILWFNTDSGKLGLILNLIPATPEAFLVDDSLRILARSRTIRKAEDQITHFVLPDGSRSPTDLSIRPELVKDAEAAFRYAEADTEKEAFELRLMAAQKKIREMIKLASDRTRQSTVALTEARREPDWMRFGTLIKNSLHNLPEIVDGKRRVHDFEAEEDAEIPSDPKLTPQEQTEKFFSMARRKARRMTEAKGRAEQFSETLARLERLVETPPPVGDWSALEKLEHAAQITLARPGGGTGLGSRSGAALSTGGNISGFGGKTSGPGGKNVGWLGKSFTSNDGLAIWVGRSKDENLELTFKHTRGNDIWMHVRGRPGAHTVVPMQPGKSAPLETLLDAAHLTLFYSGGEKWGTTEVDYTYKKYVKRIKDSSEASYTNNKTLMIQSDPVRMKRLLGSSE